MEGDTLTLNLIIVKGDQLNTENIDIRLKGTFTEGEFVAYSELLRWTDKQVDANEIKRMAGLVKFVREWLGRLVQLVSVFQLSIWHRNHGQERCNYKS